MRTRHRLLILNLGKEFELISLWLRKPLPGRYSIPEPLSDSNFIMTKEQCHALDLSSTCPSFIIVIFDIIANMP